MVSRMVEVDIPDGWELGDSVIRVPKEGEYWYSLEAGLVYLQWRAEALPSHSLVAQICITSTPKVIVRKTVDMNKPMRDRFTKEPIRFLTMLPCGRLAFGVRKGLGTWGTTSCEPNELDTRFENYDDHGQIF
jgi:hypothetical protein